MRHALATGLLMLGLCAVVGVAHAAGADESRVEVADSAEQGSVVIGRVPPGSRVDYGDRSLRLTDAGRFVIGLDRDAPKTVSLTVTLPDGHRVTREIEVARRVYDIQRIDGLPSRKVTPSKVDMKHIRRDIRLAKEARRRNDPRPDFMTGWEWPVTGPVTGVYGSQRVLNGKPRRPHYGVDIAAPRGTPVHAPADGVVTLAEPDMFFSGGTLILDHGHGLSSAFLHLSRITVPAGRVVHRGDKIAEVGATGRVTGAHLDWRMNWFDRRVDPALLVPPMPDGED